MYIFGKINFIFSLKSTLLEKKKCCFSRQHRKYLNSLYFFGKTVFFQRFENGRMIFGAVVLASQGTPEEYCSWCRFYLGLILRQ